MRDIVLNPPVDAPEANAPGVHSPCVVQHAAALGSVVL